MYDWNAEDESSMKINPVGLQRALRSLDDGNLLKGPKIGLDRVQPLELYEYKVAGDPTYHRIYIDSPLTLRDFKKRTDVVEVYQSLGTPSDLKPQDITWEVDGVHHSIWESESVELQFLLEDIMNSDSSHPSSVLSDLSDLGNEITRKEC